MTKDKKYEPPKRTTGDMELALARAGLSTIPIAGGAAVELLQILLSSPLEKRRDEWMNEVANAVRSLEENQGIKLEDLQGNAGFIDTVLHASQIALRNSQKEKREALKNGIINAALPNSLEQSIQQMFLTFIDTFTVWHIRLLKLFDDPQRWSNANNKILDNLDMGGLDLVLEKAFPELIGKKNFYDQIWRDLYSHGLVNIEDLHSTIWRGMLDKRTTELGMQFINFVQSPK